MSSEVNQELYTADLIGLLELVWGEGWLSPGGPDEVRRLIADTVLEGKSLLDIGCGTGGIDIMLAEEYKAGPITAIDVESTVLDVAKRNGSKHGLENLIAFLKVDPGPLPFPEASFDVVFSKDSILHIPDKERLMADIFHVLVPGGRFLASDWLISHEGEPSAEMSEYLAAEGLRFQMASPERYRHALELAGFVDIEVFSRNEWYREIAEKELRSLKGELYDQAIALFGKEFTDHNIEIWEKMRGVLETGEHCPHHLKATKPG